MKSGFIGLIGRPNVGKSSLLNKIIGEKIAITTNVAGTTRNIIQGVYTSGEYQMIFVDTPGIHKPKHKLGRILNKEAYITLNDVDVVLFLVDITTDLGAGDKYIIKLLENVKKPIILVINKIDMLPKERILLKINEYKDLYNFEHIIPVSALKGENVDRLINTLKAYLTDNIKYFQDDDITNVSTNFIVGELVREKILELTHDEVPHSVICNVIKFTSNQNKANIMCDIVVDRESVKKIIVGKGGTMIKEIGTRARVDIEKMLGKKVYLELFVKVVSSWHEKDQFLNEIGFKDFNN